MTTRDDAALCGPGNNTTQSDLLPQLKIFLASVKAFAVASGANPAHDRFLDLNRLVSKSLKF
jgi:hypothetical protein